MSPTELVGRLNCPPKGRIVQRNKIAGILNRRGQNRISMNEIQIALEHPATKTGYTRVQIQFMKETP